MRLKGLKASGFEGLGIRVQGLGFEVRVPGPGCRVQGLGFRVCG